MKPIEDYFDDRNVIEQLISIRLATADKRHDRHFLSAISSAAPTPWEVVEPVVDHLLPPRRQWRRPKPEDRRGLGASQVNRIALRRTVLGYRAQGRLGETDWGEALLGFIGEVQEAISSSSPALGSPTIRALPKLGKKDTFRVIATYDNLKDRVLLSILAKYLRDCFEPDMVSSLYSFRASRSQTHHAAVNNLNAYRQRYADSGLFVAEIDVRGFYDTISHGEVRQAINRAATQARRRRVVVDSKALGFIEAYLGSYNFYEYAMPAAEAELRRKGLAGEIDHLPYGKLQKMGHDTGPFSLGLPQGGGLSPLLANIVLSCIDRSVLGVPSPEQPFYARFCDDIILAHPDKKKCQSALDRCMSEMQLMRVPYHKPDALARYGSEHYKGKSKLPYLWAEPRGRKKVVPWVSFLGYQLRYDGLLRVRKVSVEREMQKHVRNINQVIHLLRQPGILHAEGESILDRTRLRLISMGIGRKELRAMDPAAPQSCWVDAFFLLDSNRHSQAQFKALDKSRQRQLWRLQSMLKRKGLLEESKPVGPGEPTPFYWGAPYSYYGHLCRSQREPVRYPPPSGKGYST